MNTINVVTVNVKGVNKKAANEFDSYEAAKEFATEVKSEVSVIKNRAGSDRFEIYRNSVDDAIDVAEFLSDDEGITITVYSCNEQALEEAKVYENEKTIQIIEENLGEDLVVIVKEGYYYDTMPSKVTKIESDSSYYQLAVIF